MYFTQPIGIGKLAAQHFSVGSRPDFEEVEGRWNAGEENMARRIEVEFEGGMKVNARVGEHLIRTDQPVHGGGEGSAPAPMDYFLASLATCSALYALEFCRTRGIPTGELKVVMEIEKDRQRKIYSPIRIRLTLPPGFPEKYREAIIRAVNLCAVKRHMDTKPDFEVILEESGGQ